MLLTFSSNRDFSMALNEPYGLELQFDLKDFEAGTYADLTYQVIHRMIKVGPGILRPLYKSLVSVISNTAPYVKSLTKDSCESIFMLIKTFSNPDLLKKREETSRILSNLFEAINYILLYHDQGNEEFLVALIKYREVLKINDLRLAIGGESQVQEIVQPVNTDEKLSEESKKEKEIEAEQPKDVDTAKVEKEENKDEVVKEDKADDKQEVKDEQEVVTQEDTKEDTQEDTKEDKQDDKQEDTKEDKKDDKQEEKQEEKQEVQNEDKKEDKQEELATETTQEESKEKSLTEEEHANDDPNHESKNDDKEESKEDQNEENMVDVPLDDIRHKENNAAPAGTHQLHQFLTPEWEAEWKKNLNFPNLKHAIQFTDDKARAFLSKNPSPDNNIDADKVTIFV
jgi:hypothetical protein